MPFSVVSFERIEALKSALGHLVMEWNYAEHRLLSLLAGMLRQDEEALRIITAHMPSDAKIKALQACFSEMEEDILTQSVAWVCAAADELRNWRNFYVHSLMGTFLATDETEPAQAVTHSLSARGKVIVRKFIVTTDEIHNIANHCMTLSFFIDSILRFIEYPISSDSMHRELPLVPPSPPRWEAYLQAQKSAQRRPRSFQE